MIVLTMGYRLVYIGRIFPGVSVAGVDVSGMTREKAAVKIQGEHKLAVIAVRDNIAEF